MPCGDASRRVGDIPSSRRPRAGFIRPAWQRCPSLAEGRPGIAGQRRRRPRQRKFGPTDANKVLFSPEDTRRHCDRRVR